MHNEGSFPADKDDKKPVFFNPYDQMSEEELAPVSGAQIPAPTVPEGPVSHGIDHKNDDFSAHPHTGHGIPQMPGAPTMPVVPDFVQHSFPGSSMPAEPVVPSVPIEHAQVSSAVAPETVTGSGNPAGVGFSDTESSGQGHPVHNVSETDFAPAVQPVMPAPPAPPVPPVVQSGSADGVFNSAGNYPAPGVSNQVPVNPEYPAEADHQVGGVAEGNDSNLAAGAHSGAETTDFQPFAPIEQKPKKKTKILLWGVVGIAVVAVIVVICLIVSAMGNLAASNHADVQPAKPNNQIDKPQPPAPAPEKNPVDPAAARFCSAYKVKKIEYDKLLEEYEKIQSDTNPPSIDDRKQKLIQGNEILVKVGQTFKELAADASADTKKLLLDTADRINTFVKVPFEQLADEQTIKLAEELDAKISKVDTALTHDVLSCI